MADLSGTVAGDLADYYEFVAKRLHKWVDPLSNEQFWHNPYPYGNSVGHLVLHLTGNLSYYIGARIAATGYVRDRDREFTETSRPPKDQVLEKFDRTIALVVATMSVPGATRVLAQAAKVAPAAPVEVVNLNTATMAELRKNFTNSDEVSSAI